MAKFKPGQSGNPAGKPKGTKDKRSVFRDMLTPHGPALVAKAVELALGGDTTALRLCLDRLAPPLKARDEPVTLSSLKGRLAEQGQAVLTATAKAELSPDQATKLLQALAAQARLVETDELERRVAALEARHEKPA